ncbi:hypothetical protein ALC57_05798 [Trachymyrmex cornetzi]|uniref:Uncharacterized protein n=1 Tax=Trachymyrmex cornetzi TaxID=471704 RepID=A0A151J9S1_9HYME|nr:hypothetical protein ALC57_05798 [Trachymyrmex cornetzi]
MLDITLENLKNKAYSFFYFRDKKLLEKEFEELELRDVLKEAETFFPATEHILHISLP